MTLFAGIVRLDGHQLSTAAAEHLVTLISRTPTDKVEQFSGEAYFLAKVDIGVLGSPGVYQDATGSVSLLAGEPLLKEAGSAQASRWQDLQSLHAYWRTADMTLLPECNGTFCAAFFDPGAVRLWLIADKLGVRPIYYTEQDGVVYFATALRILEELAVLRKRMDVRGVTEIAAFGYPLGERTPYTNITTIYPGEVVEFSPHDGMRRFTYWRWDRLPPTTESPDTLPKALYQRFQNAVVRRLNNQKTVVSFLSGGLDSRCIVAILRDLGVIVHSLNFAPVGSEDFEFGHRIANKLGTLHFEHPLGLAVDTSAFYKEQTTHQFWLDSLQEGRTRPERPYVIWSGDGGSVGLGHVYLTENMIEIARRGNPHRTAAAFLQHNPRGVPKKLFHPKLTQRITTFPPQGIVEELNRLESVDAGRALHLFLMGNDQRRHLAQYFEKIDLQRLELVFPFFDGDFLELILTSPIDPFLLHRFYNDWLKQFPPAVLEIPWQTYPGHVPCSLPKPDNLSYQWRDFYTKAEQKRILDDSIAQADTILSMRSFPTALLSRHYLRAARWATRLGFGNYGYIINTAELFCSYWQRCEGEYG